MRWMLLPVLCLVGATLCCVLVAYVSKARRSPAESKLPRRLLERRSGNARIFAIEDDGAFADTLRSGFQQHDVTLVFNIGDDAVERIESDPPDLILLSIEASAINGFLLCKRIKSHDALKSIPLIILSSDDNAAAIFKEHQRLRSRADAYLVKPTSFDELLAVVRTYISVGG